MGLGGRLRGGLQRGLQRGLQTGLGRGLAVKIRSVKVQVRFSSVLKFNSLELDSDIVRLVNLADKLTILTIVEDREASAICQRRIMYNLPQFFQYLALPWATFGEEKSSSQPLCCQFGSIRKFC